MQEKVDIDGEDIVLEEIADDTNTVPENNGYTLLVDSYEATIATVGGDGYNEYCLYQKDDVYEIHYFRKYEGENETHEAYLTDKKCSDELFAYIEKEKLINYEGLSFGGMTGGIFVIKFKEGDKMIRISSDNVPYQNHYVFSEIRNILLKNIDKDKKLL